MILDLSNGQVVETEVHSNRHDLEEVVNLRTATSCVICRYYDSFIPGLGLCDRNIRNTNDGVQRMSVSNNQVCDNFSL